MEEEMSFLMASTSIGQSTLETINHSRLLSLPRKLGVELPERGLERRGAVSRHRVKLERRDEAPEKAREGKEKRERK